MKQEISQRHDTDAAGTPDGGYTEGTGLWIRWQRGPLGRGEDRAKPNGCFVETVIDAALGRLMFYEQTRFACAENREAIQHLEAALRWLRARTMRREVQGVEGTHGLWSESSANTPLTYSEDEVEVKRVLIAALSPLPNDSLYVSGASACAEARWLATLDALRARIATLEGRVKAGEGLLGEIAREVRSRCDITCDAHYRPRGRHSPECVADVIDPDEIDAHLAGGEVGS